MATNLESLTIGQAREIAAMFGTVFRGCANTEAACGRQIVIGERGWVWVGDVSRQNGDYILTNASVIRVWGTKRGLGELATQGKQPGTVLDPCGTVRVPEIAVIGRIDVAAGVPL